MPGVLGGGGGYFLLQSCFCEPGFAFFFLGHLTWVKQIKMKVNESSECVLVWEAPAEDAGHLGVLGGGAPPVIAGPIASPQREKASYFLGFFFFTAQR